MKRPKRRCYAFGSFHLDTRERSLLRQRDVVPLTPKCFDILLLLVENNGHLVTKEELMAGVWPDAFVEEGNLSYNISMLRKVLGKTPIGGEYIETVPRCGFRFVAEVTEVAEGAVGSSPVRKKVLSSASERRIRNEASKQHESPALEMALMSQLGQPTLPSERFEPVRGAISLDPNSMS